MARRSESPVFVPVLLLLCVLLGLSHGLERERESGGVESANEETTEQVPVTSIRPSGAADDSGEATDGAEGEPTCSRLVCRLKCQLNGCFHSECLDNGRCRCYCARRVDPLQAFFSSILSSHMEPGLTVRIRPIAFVPASRPSAGQPNDKPGQDEAASTDVVPKRTPVFGLSHFGGFHGFSGFPDFNKLFDEAAVGGGLHAKVFQTMQQTCRAADDCSVPCANCTQTECTKDNLCQCTGCPARQQQQDGLESRSKTSGDNTPQTCRSARNCADHCRDCVITTCRYGVCDCGQCSNNNSTGTPEVEQDASTLPSSEEPASTTPASAADGQEEATTTTPVQDTEVLKVRNNQTVSAAAEAGHAGKCVPKRCNHSCWERQCSKWNCVADRCECDGCPDEVAVVVKTVSDGVNDANSEKKIEKIQQQEEATGNNERNKYEIIF